MWLWVKNVGGAISDNISLWHKTSLPSLPLQPFRAEDNGDFLSQHWIAPHMCHTLTTHCECGLLHTQTHRHTDTQTHMDRKLEHFFGQTFISCWYEDAAKCSKFLSWKYISDTWHLSLSPQLFYKSGVSFLKQLSSTKSDNDTLAKCQMVALIYENITEQSRVFNLWEQLVSDG